MLLKPIPPTKYDGSPDATLFYRWCRESTSFVRVGRVPPTEQLFYLSYHLTGKALDFYEQVTVRKPSTYALEVFFLDLFDFCFPADFRVKMRDQLDECSQDSKPVLEHIAAFEQLWRVVGLSNDQGKVIRFWSSLREDLQQELYRKDLDPEMTPWDEVVHAAERAENWLKLDITSKLPLSSSAVSDPETDASTSDSKEHTYVQHRSHRHRRRNFIQASSAGFKPVSRRRNELFAQGLCFTCEQPGHLARDCPTTTNVASDQESEHPGFGVHALGIPSVSSSAYNSALYRSTEVLHTLPLEAVTMIFEDESIVEVGGEPNESFRQKSANFSDQEVEYIPPPARSIKVDVFGAATLQSRSCLDDSNSNAISNSNKRGPSERIQLIHKLHLSCSRSRPNQDLSFTQLKFHASTVCDRIYTLARCGT
jgi:hypothetical protein